MPDGGFVVGVDTGSQSCKVSVFDAAAALVAEGSAPLRPYSLPGPGLVEHPDDDVWEATATAIRRALDTFDGDPADIRAVGVCGIRFCRALLREDGTLAQPMQSWMDDRVGAPLTADVDDVAWVTTSSGYLGHRLTGEVRDTAANYQGLWPVDTDTWAWSEDRAAFGETQMPLEMLFELVDPGEILGGVHAAAAEATGLAEGTPVVATANDKAVEALGSGLLHDGSVLVSLGTYVAAMTPGARNRAGEDFWTNFGARPGSYIYESTGVRRGMWTVSWFREQLARGADETELNREAAAVPAGSDGLMTTPDWLAPSDASFRRGSMLGFDARHTRGHVYRSVLEGIALTMRGHVDRMAAELRLPIRRLVVSGGGAESEVMMQIMADVFDLPAERLAGTSGAGRGAAMLAGVATGMFADIEQATEAMVAIRDVHRPEPDNVDLYRRLADVYRDVIPATDCVYRRLSELFATARLAEG